MYVYVNIHRYICTYILCCTGWRRLIGSPKLQIIFYKRAIKYRSLLRKMTYKDKGSYASSPPCTLHCGSHGIRYNAGYRVAKTATYINVHICIDVCVCKYSYIYLYIYTVLYPALWLTCHSLNFHSTTHINIRIYTHSTYICMYPHMLSKKWRESFPDQNSFVFYKGSAAIFCH